MISTLDGTPFACSHDFLDDSGLALVPDPGYPKVYVRDNERNVVSLSVAVPDSLSVGRWSATVSMPEIGVSEDTPFQLVWVMRSDGSKNTDTDVLMVRPAYEARSSDIVLLNETEFDLALNVDPSAFTGATVKLYADNVEVASIEVDESMIRRTATKVILLLSIDTPPSLTSRLLHVRLKNSRTTLTFKLWHITPQIALTMSHVMDRINKARLSNVIPELEYTDGDLLSYIENGLNLFNTIGYVTSFNGTNMHGPLFTAHVDCSVYYALCAQLMAEGQLAFDFGGQGVSLNVDRTPQIEGAIGRIESSLSERILPLKKQLTRQGLIGGDGSVGKTTMRNPRAQGRLTVINAPTTLLMPEERFHLVGRRVPHTRLSR